MSASESLDTGFDDMAYAFEELSTATEAYRGEHQLWCAVLERWLLDLADRDDYVRRQAWGWLNNRKDMCLVCSFVGINPELLQKAAKERGLIG